MTHACQQEDRILDLVNQTLSKQESDLLTEHMTSCATCRAHYDALNAHGRLCEELTDMMNPRLDKIEKQVIDSLNADINGEAAGSLSAPFRMRFGMKWAAVAAGLLLVFGIFLLVQQQGPVDPDGGQKNPLQTDRLLAEQQRSIETSIANMDIDGLVAMLDSGLWQSKCLAALGLKDIGDERALPSLAKFSTLWEDAPEDEPFDQAITAINERIEPLETSVPDPETTPRQAPNTPVTQVQSVMPQASNLIQGQTVNRQGTPVSGAKLLLYHNLSLWSLDNEVVEETVSDTRGHYRFSTPMELTLNNPTRSEWIVLAVHPEYAFGWKNIPNKLLLDPFEITLTEPVKKTLQVTDAEGQPLADALVWPFAAGTHESPDPLFREAFSLPTYPGYLGKVTDQDGLVTFANLPKTGCSFHAALKGFSQGLAFPSQDTIHLTLGATVAGQVVTPNGQGVSRATVTLKADWGYWCFWKTRTDEQGFFRFQDLPAKGWDMSPWGKGKTGTGEYVLTMDHPDTSLAETRLTLERGQLLEDYLLEAEADRVQVDCLVVTHDTNEPMAGVRISGRSISGRLGGYTDNNGIISFHVAPGNMSLNFYSPPKGLYILDEDGVATRGQDYVASGSHMEITLTAPPIAGTLVTLEGTILAPDGSTLLKDAKIFAAVKEQFNTATASGYIRPVSTDSSGLFRLKEVPAGLTVNLYAETKDRAYAAIGTVEIPEDPGETPRLELTAAPTVPAKTVISYEDGSPLVDRKIELSPMVGGCRLWPAQRGCRTNVQGELDLGGIVPGLTYHLRDTQAFEERMSSTGDQTRPAELQRILVPL